jgi:hypothetical protein
MAEPRAIRWLHLSDLHLGCQREDLWWQVQEDLAASVRAFADRLGPPDLLLLSGDLTNTGAAKQFERVDRLLDALLGWLAESGGAAPLIVVFDVEAHGVSFLLYHLSTFLYSSSFPDAVATQAGPTGGCAAGWNRSYRVPSCPR